MATNVDRGSRVKHNVHITGTVSFVNLMLKLITALTKVPMQGAVKRAVDVVQIGNLERKNIMRSNMTLTSTQRDWKFAPKVNCGSRVAPRHMCIICAH